MKRFSLFLILILSCQIGQSKLMTPELLMEVQRISDFHLSPDGKHILFSVMTPNLGENNSRTDIYTIKIDGTDLKRITTSGTSNYGGSWSPDGKKICFISNRDGSSQAYIIDFNGGEAQKITDVENGVSNLIWSPDGKHFSFTSDVKIDKTEQEIYPDMNKANVLIYDDLPIRHWDHFIDEKYRHLFVMDIDGTNTKDLMENERYEAPLKPFGGRSQIAWSFDGSEIAYTSKKVDDFEMSTNSEIYLAPIFGGTTQNITLGLPGFDKEPAFSPNGRYISFISMERAGYEADRERLMLYDRRTMKITELSNKLDQSVHHPVWSPDSKNIYFYAGNNDGTYQIYEMNVATGDYKVLSEGFYNWGDRGLDITPDGKTLITSRRNWNRPTEIYSLEIATGKTNKITGINDELFADIETGKIESRWIESTDGQKVHTWVMYPPNFDENKKYPAMTYCQGGPQAMVSQHFSYGWNFLTFVSEGYIMIAPNRRGCPGFGQDWVDAIAEDYGGQPMQDIIAATDAIAKEPYVDENKVGAIGGSAGGYAVFWLAGNHEGRFSAFMSHCGMFNMVSKYGATEELWFPNWDNGGPYWDNPEYYEVHSPHTYVNNWDTPIIITTGELDYRVPYSQSLEAFTAAQALGIPSKLIYYPEENHWILKFQEQVIWFREFFDFFGKYLK